MSVLQVLCTVLRPYASTPKDTHMVFLVCGSVVQYADPFVKLKDTILELMVASAIIFSATRFRPLVATNFLLVMAELVIVEHLDLRKAFPTLLSLSSHLRQHSKVILMTLDDAADSPRLLVTTFMRAHPQTQPCGVEVPAQYPTCGSTNSWSEKVAVLAFDELQDVDARDRATVASYLYSCTYPNCGKNQGAPPQKISVNKPPGSILNMGRGKNNNWFQSPSTIFPPPASVPSSSVSSTSSNTQDKCASSSDGSVPARKRARRV